MQARPHGLCHGGRTHAHGHRRARADRHPPRPAAVAHLRQQGYQDLSGIQGFLRHRGSHRAGGRRTSAMPRRAWKKSKQILYLLGPVGGGKSSIAEKLKSADGAGAVLLLKGSPVNESPLGLFNEPRTAPMLEEEYGIPRRYLQRIMSPWAVKRLRGIRRRHPQVPRRQALPVGPASRSRSPRPSRATRTTRTSRRWSARSTSASWRPMRRTTRTPTATPAACAWPTRACWNSSRCSRRRSRCCTRC